jgi:membrane-associated phospholipid phosphatase
MWGQCKKERKMRLRLMMVAASATVGVWLIYYSLVTSSTGQHLDQAAMLEAFRAAPPETTRFQHLLNVVSVPSIAVALGVCAAVALKRSRPDLALAAAATVVGANLTSQLLKSVLDRPDLGHGITNSFPSGHVTVVSSVAAAALLVAPRPAQAVVFALGAATVATTAIATVALGWHRPSDVAGAVLVSVGWAAAATAVLGRRSTSAGDASRRTFVA